jgi:hypothetical protein
MPSIIGLGYSYGLGYNIKKTLNYFSPVIKAWTGDILARVANILVLAVLWKGNPTSVF